jgi:hypothetical protein
LANAATSSTIFTITTLTNLADYVRQTAGLSDLLARLMAERKQLSSFPIF